MLGRYQRFITITACLAIAVTAMFVVPWLTVPVAQEQSVAAAQATAPPKGTGRPIPRFVSLKADEVNVRRGPSQSHQVAWVFSKKGLPVEVIAEYEHWRRVRDSEGEEGWVFHSLLTGIRTGLVAPWRKSQRVTLYDGPGGDGTAIAVVEAGVLGRVLVCNGSWCEFTTSGYKGWIKQDQIWGVYPGEKIE